MKSNQWIGIAIMVAIAMLWTAPAVDEERALADPVKPNVGLAAALLGWQPSDAQPSPGPTPQPAPNTGTHARANCPTGGYVTHGDGHRTRCPDCDPPYGAADEPQDAPESPEAAPVTITSVLIDLPPQTLSEALGVDDPRLASPTWTYPGTIQNHLATTHDVPEARGLSRTEAIDLHNRLHNAERRGVPVGAVSAPLLIQSPDCPNGLCPTDAFGSALCPDGTCPTSSPFGSSGSGAVGLGNGGPVVERVRKAAAAPLRLFQRLRSRGCRGGC